MSTLNLFLYNYKINIEFIALFCIVILKFKTKHKMKIFLKVICMLTALTFSIDVIAQFGPGGGGGGGGGSRPEGGRDRSGGQQMPTLDLDGNAPKGNSKIFGNVIDESVTTAVEFANIALINKVTKKPIDGAMADEKGAFSMKRVAAGEYNIQISFIGFETKIIENIKVEKGKDIDLGVIKLKQSLNQLSEVVVSGQAALIEEKVDRLVYNAEKDLLAKGGDASDVLKNVPMLSVDLEGNVSLRGSQNIKVLINNKPSTIVASSIADALKMIPADLIKSVEVITSPSAKYDAEGSAGIINIITKKSTLQGLNLNVDTGVGLRASNLGLNGNYRQGKLGISLGGHGRMMYNKASSVSEQTIFGSNISTTQTSNGNHRGAFGRYNLGFDYDLAKNQTLSAGLAFGIRKFDRTQNLLSNKSSFGVDIKDLRYVSVIDNSNSIDANLDYIRIFKPGQEWSISTQYSQNILINNFTSDFLTLDGAKLNSQQNINNNINKEITLQTDYVSPINTNQQIEFGVKTVFRNVNSDFNYEKKAEPNAKFEPDLRNPFGFLNYGQQVMAGYLSYLYTTKSKVSFKLGTRYESTQIIADDQKGKILIPKYENLVPSINISKKLKKSTIKIAYNRRIQRPGLQQLNPNINLANQLNVSKGNPFLSPELTDNLELSLSGSVKKSYITAAVYVRQTGNSINRISTPIDSINGFALQNGAILTSFENIGKEKNMGLNLFGNVYFNSNWTMNGGVDINYKYLEGQQVGVNGLSSTISNSGFVIGGRLMTNFKLKNGWAMQASGGSRGAQITLQGMQSGMNMYSMGFRKDFKNKKGSLGLAVENFFGGMKMISTTESPLLYQKSTNNMYNSNVKMTFAYKFGNMKFVQEKKTKKVKNDDVKGGEEN
jgi:ferric enterobactin receptor